MIYQKKGKKKPGLFGPVDESPLGLDLNMGDPLTEDMAGELPEEEETPRERMYRELREKALERRGAAQKGLEEMEDPMEQASRAEEQMRLASLMKGLMGAASKFGSHQPKSDMGHLGEMAQSRVREAEGAKKRQARLQSALESAENRLLALRKGERGEVLEDARESRAQAGEKRAGEMHDINKGYKKTQTEELQKDIQHLDSPIDDVTKAYLRKGLEAAGVKNVPDMDRLTYRQLQKHPVLSKALAAGANKANYQRTSLQDPDGVVREYVVDVNNPKDKQLVGTKGYSPDSYFDPQTGYRVRIPKQAGMGGAPAQGGQGQAGPQQPSEPKERKYGDLNPKQKKEVENLRKEIKSDASVKRNIEALESAHGADNAMELVRKGDIGALGTVSTIVAGAIQKGVLTDADIQRSSGEHPDLVGRTSDAIEKYLLGLPPQKQIATLESLLDAAKRNASVQLDNSMSRYKEVGDSMNLPEHLYMPAMPAATKKGSEPKKKSAAKSADELPEY